MEKRKCPACQKDFKLPPLSLSVSLPPTGGDYEWMEGTVELQCPHCYAELKVVVRQTLRGETLKINELQLKN